MFNNNINEELYSAVFQKNLEKVKALVSSGADVNYNYRDGESLLHISRNVEITNELLLSGADVNNTNTYREPPLHTVITSTNDLELVRELLKYGADVNYCNRKGNTALNTAVAKRTKNLEIIKELLEHGADINIRNRSRIWYNNHATSLDNAMAHPDVAKLLIKITLIKNFCKDYVKLIDLNPYTEWPEYSEISAYLKECAGEICQMKIDEVRNGLSLYECITNHFSGRVVYNNNQLCVKLSKIDYSTHYPIYKDLLLEKFTERVNLLDKLHNITFYTKFKGQKIILNYDSIYNVTEYLSTKHLLNLILAFDDSKNHGFEAYSVTDLVEPSTSSDAKRIRVQ